MARNRNKKKTRREDSDFLRTVSCNMQAMAEGPKPMRWSIHDIKQIQPMTENQKEFFHSYFQGDNIVAYGSAGTGKSFLGLFLGLRDVVDKKAPQDKMIIVRSAVPSREVGHLPGDLNEKMAVYETPYSDICAELFGKAGTYENMKERGVIEFLSTSYVRGSTWDNTVVVIDESQNLTWHEINSVMTRLGQNSRVIFTGDIKQSDLNRRKSDVSGMTRLIQTADRMKEFSTIQFTTDDIVRSEIVKSWIIAAEQTEEDCL